MPSRITDADLRRWFTHRHTTTDQASRIETIRHEFHWLAHVVLRFTRPGDDQAAAIRALRSAMTVATSAVFCEAGHEPEPDAPLDATYTDTAIDELMRYLRKADADRHESDDARDAADDTRDQAGADRDDARDQAMRGLLDHAEALIDTATRTCERLAALAEAGADLEAEPEPEPEPKPGPEPFRSRYEVDAGEARARANLHETIRDRARAPGHTADGAGGTGG